ncbi:branched-chain amino acid ABC transporter permease [Marinobacter sp.]|uniref:branched-chain amino acid ABC transporter permease n=1 Tax=Marinobacter sp. TaxID=50741 RepID=UPI00198861DB|nr:branched-chain amino acid ABC transporter permease [Marinobacter sp.]MBC7193243.1 branched-chain amino acid ABC transporter permease [Marinobacter sp.]
MITASIISGLSMGSMYALLALGFHITFIVSRTVNFAQGSAVMVGAVLGYTFCITWGLPWLLAAVLTLTICALYGLAIERFLVRPFHSRGSEAWLLATVAGGLFIDNLVMFTFGKEPRRFTLEAVNHRLELAGTGVDLMQLIIPAVVAIIVISLVLVQRYTHLGKVLAATVQNPSAARMMGVHVNRVVAASFAVSTVLAGIGGLLIAPLVSVHSDMGTLFGLKAFAVAILGGIASANGVVMAGLLFGLAEALIIVYLGSTMAQIVTFSLVIVILAMRPNGLFGSKTLVKV